MSEIILMVGNKEAVDAFKDGDLIQAFNNKHIQFTHANMICHVRKEGCNSDGLRIMNTLPDMYLSNLMQYKFQRVSNNTVKRIDLSSAEEVLLSQTIIAKCKTCGKWVDVTEKDVVVLGRRTNKFYCDVCAKDFFDNGEYMHVADFIRRRLKHKHPVTNEKLHAIFGTAGNEYWYGGHQDNAQSKVDTIWTEIESRTANRKADHTLWPLTPVEKSHFYGVSTDDFTDDEGAKMEGIVSDNNLEVYDNEGILEDSYKNGVDPAVDFDVNGFPKNETELLIKATPLLDKISTIETELSQQLIEELGIAVIKRQRRGTLIRKRLRKVDYLNNTGMSELTKAKVLNRGQQVDLRQSFSKNRADIVDIKPW